MLRKLAAEQNEHGDGKQADEMAEDLLRGARALARGVSKEIKLDVNPILKIMERTDPEVKESRITILDDGVVPMK